MLRARPQSADQQRDDEHGIARARSGEAIAEPGERGATGKDRGSAKLPGQHACRNLKDGHRSGEQAAQQANRGIAQAEFDLPDRQHHINQIGIAVVQRMRARSDAEGAALVRRVGTRLGLRNGAHGANPHGTNAVLTKEITRASC